MPCFASINGPQFRDTGISPENLHEEEDKTPYDYDDTGNVCDQVEAAVWCIPDEDTAVEVYDAELNKAICWDHDCKDDELDLYEGADSSVQFLRAGIDILIGSSVCNTFSMNTCSGLI